MSTGRLCSVGKYWNENFSDFDELHQQSHTRFPGGLVEHRSTARLDRILWNAPLEAFALWDIQAATLSILPETYPLGALSGTGLSDHIPVVASICFKQERASNPCVPHFVTQSNLFKNAVEKLMNEHKFAKCCWA